MVETKEHCSNVAGVRTNASVCRLGRGRVDFKNKTKAQGVFAINNPLCPLQYRWW